MLATATSFCLDLQLLFCKYAFCGLLSQLFATRCSNAKLPAKVLQVMPTQDSFEAAIYLAIMHGDTTLSDLKTGQANLKFEVSERTGQLKDLASQLQRCMTCSLHAADLRSVAAV